MPKFSLPRISLRRGAVGFGVVTAFVFGLALFLGIADLGFARIGGEIASVGWGLLGMIAVHLTQIGFCSLAWRSVLSNVTASRNGALANLFLLRWVRESIDSLLPVAQVGGEVAAARLLTGSGLDLPTAGASIIADVTIEALTQAAITLIGLSLIFTIADAGDVAQWAALGFAIAAVFASLAVLAQRWGGVRLFEKLLLVIAERTGWNGLEGVSGLDAALGRVYRTQSRLFLAGLFHLTAWSLGAFEVLIAAHALGYRLDLGQSFVIESLAQALRSAAFFVPGALGVQEGGFVVLAGLFGVPVDAALSIALTKRVRELALGLPGLLAWQFLELRPRLRARRDAADRSGHK